MANPDPWQARLAKRRKERKRRKPGDLSEARAVLWHALEALDDHLLQLMEEDEPSTAALTKIVHAAATAIGSYAKLVEVGNLEEEVQDLRERIGGLEGRTLEA